MNLVSQNRLRILGRNEGKIKSYESCTDGRAWSHDFGARDQYLREWMKCDMPSSTIPVSTLTRFFKDMTCRSRAKTAPKCHRDCKSKVLLDSISKSCHAIRECLKENEKYEKYFQEEEFETSHWPCDRCLDALKSIKMFWKIIVEKLFNTNVPKDDSVIENFKGSDNLHSLAKNWQNEMVQQASFVKSISVHTCKEEGMIPKVNYKYNQSYNKFKGDVRIRNVPSRVQISDNNHYSCMHGQDRKSSSVKSSMKSQCCKTKLDSTNQLSYTIVTKKPSKSTSVKVKTLDICCDSCNFQNEQEELKTCKTNLQYLQDQYNAQLCEIDKLNKENVFIKAELKIAHKKEHVWSPPCYTPPSVNSTNNALVVIPKPYEACVDEKVVSHIDSEMIITMKNCKNDGFKHVSLLQVLHKSNAPEVDICHASKDETSRKKEDPIALLNKVHHKFGAIVRREVTLVNKEKTRKKKISDIDAYQKINDLTKSTVSCTTLSSLSIASLSNFMSAKETSDVEQKKSLDCDV